MPMFRSVLGATMIMALLIGVPWWYKLDVDRHFRNFHVVTPGKLYRSGQHELESLQDLVRHYGIKTIVCLRASDTETSRREEGWARGAGLTFLRIPPRPWHYVDGEIPAERGLNAFRRIMDDPAQHPVLVHCFKGIHRTGAYCAIYRIDYDRWSNHEALNEMRLMGYDTLEYDRDILDYLESYRPTRPE